jgi:hypothetical protein
MHQGVDMLDPVLVLPHGKVDIVYYPLHALDRCLDFLVDILGF